jgi:hypothetical protein
MNMKSRTEAAIGTESKPENSQVIADAADFHSTRIKRESKIKSKRASANKPAGDDEYEQMVAEDADFNTGKLISEAAYFIAERRGFTPGSELSDWLRAETEIEGLLRSAVTERRKVVADERRGRSNLKA